MPPPTQPGSFADATPPDRLRLLQILLDHLPVNIFALDLEGRILLANRFMEELFRAAPGGLDGRSRADLMSPEEADARRRADLEACRIGQPVTSLDRLKRPDGSELRFLSIRAPWRDDSGRIASIVGIATELDWIRQIENRLLVSEARHRLLFDQNPQPMWVFDPETRRFLAVNDTAVGVYGFSRDEFLSMTLDQIRPPEEIPLLHERIASLRDGYRVVGEARHYTKSGQLLDVEIHYHALMWEGRAAGFAVAIDITQRKQAERALQDSEAAHRLLFEKNPQPMWVYDLESLRFLEVNEAAIRHYGYSRAEFLSMNLEDIRPPEDHPHLRADVASTTSPLNYAGDWRHRTKSGKHLDVEIRSHRLVWESRPARLVVAFDITQRKQVERDLKQSEQMYRVLTERMRDVVWVMDPSAWRYLYVSPSIQYLNGYSAEEHLAASPSLNLPPQLLAEARDAITRRAAAFAAGAAAADRSFSDVGPMPHKDGSSIWVEVVSQFHRHPETGEVELHGVTRDISARQKATEDLDAFFDASLDFHAILDLEGRFLRANPVWEQTLGYSPHHLRGCRFSEICREEDRVRGESVFASLRDSGQVDSFTIQLRHADGSCRLTDWRVRRNRDVFFCTGRDITESAAAEARLRDLSRAIEQSPASVIVTDVDGMVEYVNPKFEDLSGYTLAEIRGQNPRILQSGETPGPVYQELWRTILSGQTWNGELKNRRKDGSFYFERVSISPVRDDHGEIRHFVAVKEDVTEKKRLETQLNQAQKMEAIGMLAGGVAHDFNNLLTIINGYSELLASDTSLPEEVRQRLATIHRAGEKAAGLTRQLLLFGRRQPGHPAPLDINALLNGLAGFYERILPENIRLVVQPGSHDATIIADRSQFEQVIMNLVVNARDAMPWGGILRVDIDRVRFNPADTLGAPEAEPGPYIVLRVSDTGVGMDPEVQRRIFEPFFTTKAPGKGTGLGLPTVYGIVKQARGWIQVTSAPGEGSTFSVFLPDAGSQPPEDLATESAAAPNQAAGTILLIEDYAEVRQFAAALLARLGYEVLPASTGEEAVEIARQHPGALDLVLTDVMLPGISGPEAAGIIRGLFPGVRILFVSGFVPGSLPQAQLSLAGSQFLAKPFSADELASAVREVLSTPPAPRILIVDDDPAIREFVQVCLVHAGYRTAAAGSSEALARLEVEPCEVLLVNLGLPGRDAMGAIADLRRSGRLPRIIAMAEAFDDPFESAAEALGADATLLKPFSREPLLAAVRSVLEPTRNPHSA
jgi:PAS domain S-box-containing protein